MSRPVARNALRGKGSRTDRGSMAVEVVILTPLLVAFFLLVVAFGRYVSVRGDVEAAARDAVRAASLERTAGQAQAAANAAVTSVLPSGCQGVALSGAFVAGGMISARVTCAVPFGDLGLPGLPGAVTVVGTSSAPIDVYRRAG